MVPPDYTLADSPTVHSLDFELNLGGIPLQQKYTVELIMYHQSVSYRTYLNKIFLMVDSIRENGKSVLKIQYVSKIPEARPDSEQCHPAKDQKSVLGWDCCDPLVTYARTSDETDLINKKLESTPSDVPPEKGRIIVCDNRILFDSSKTMHIYVRQGNFKSKYVVFIKFEDDKNLYLIGSIVLPDSYSMIMRTQDGKFYNWKKISCDTLRPAKLVVHNPVYNLFHEGEIGDPVEDRCFKQKVFERGDESITIFKGSNKIPG